MAALSAGAVTVAGAQEDAACEINLTQVYLLLANAGAAYEVGNPEGALQALSEARALLQGIEAQCAGEPLPEALDTAGRNRIVVFVGEDDEYSNHGDPLSKLAGLAFVNGINLSVFPYDDEFLAQLQQPDVAAAIYSAVSPNVEVLLALRNLADAGGRVLLIYGAHGDWLDQNKLIQELFNVSIVEEGVKAEPDTLLYPSSMLPAWLRNYRVGVAQNNFVERIFGYLVSPASGGERGYLVSDESGSERLLYYSAPNERVAFWPYIWAQGSSIYVAEYFFDDENIDYFDNEEAALTLLRYLLRGSGAEAQAASILDERPPQVTDAHVERVRAIQEQASRGEISQSEAEAQLFAVAAEIGRDGLAWIVRRLPVYDAASGSWLPFEHIAEGLAAESGVAPGSRLATDPVGTAVDLLFTDPSPDQILEWLEFEE